MREIKFRMLNKGININTGKQEWDYKELPYECFDDNFTLYVSDTLSQFTGLFDKKGVEIYEGDIVSHNTTFPWKYGIVKFNENSSYYGIDIGHYNRIYSFSGGTDIKPKNIFVIGNIYENKELLNDNL